MPGATGPPTALAEPDPGEEEDDERQDDELDGQRDAVRVMADQPRESTHSPPTV